MKGPRMNIEELTNIITDEGVDKVNAALQTLGFRAFKTAPTPTVPAGFLSTGSIRLVDVGGNSLPAHEIVVEPVEGSNSITVEGSEYHPNLVYKPYRVFTDEDGVANIPLVKGSKVRIYISKSSLYREITVPDLDFNLLSPDISVTADSFSAPVVAPALVIRGDI
jgi:hypothetical protein